MTPSGSHTRSSWPILAVVLLGVGVVASGVASLEAAADDAEVGVVGPDGDRSSGTGTSSDDLDIDCSLAATAAVGATGPDVVCLESQLVAAGALTDVAPDAVFDESTRGAVERFQAANALTVDGVVGSRTASELAIASRARRTGASTCPDHGRAAVVDRESQRAWLCEQGAIIEVMPITSALPQPDPGTYAVYAKDMHSSSVFGDHSTMTHFVAFTYGEYQGARIAFHSVPRDAAGNFVQPLDSLGTADRHGDSSGCIRVAPDDAELIWDRLEIGDTVTVIS